MMVTKQMLFIGIFLLAVSVTLFIDILVWIFSEKSEEPEKKFPVSYVDFEKELGFLNLLMRRRCNTIAEYVINVYNSQKQKTDYLSDEELDPIIESNIMYVVNSLGTQYKTFLIEKYFGTENELIKFITEDMYVDLTQRSITNNLGKIRATVGARIIRAANMPTQTKK